MSETAIQRMQRMLAEKKAALANSTTEATAAGPSDAGEKKDEQLPEVSVQHNEVHNPSEVGEVQQPKEEAKLPAATEIVEPAIIASESPELVVPKSTHPIAMEMAELQAALDQNVPGFANKLREIHVKLRNDPIIVTLLSDEEIGVIVSGLERHTNVQIIAPAAIKASSRSKKVPVSASDL